ncbi:MAG: hypothetical protein E7478_00515, partial [Ruminococcaceae bacterium]|nr:hypothetical protein [Oscillospiraceae bacterium]
MNFSIKAFLPLIVCVAVIIAALVVIFVTTNSTDYMSQRLKYDYGTAENDELVQGREDSIKQHNKDIEKCNEVIVQHEAALAEAQQKVADAQAMYDELARGEGSELAELKAKNEEYLSEIEAISAALDALDSDDASVEELKKRYDEMCVDAVRFDVKREDFRTIEVELVRPNFDENNLRANQTTANFYSVLGDYTGIFGQMLSNSIDTNIYNGFDKVIAAVNIMTNTVNEHLHNADMLAIKMKTSLDAATAIMSEELSGDALAFETELYALAYAARTEQAYDEDRIALIREMEYAKRVMEAMYPVYEMLLSDSEDNERFLRDLEFDISSMSGYIGALCKEDGEGALTEEETDAIWVSALDLIPMICDVTTDPSYVYKGVRLTEHRVTFDFGYKPDELLQGKKTINGNTYTFALRQYERGNDTPHTEFYYSSDGKPLYIKYKTQTLYLNEGRLVYPNDP